MRKNLAALAALVERQDPVRVLVLGYASYVCVGWLLLSLPWCQRTMVGSLDVLFTTVSAVSTTGLTTVSTAGSWSWTGQLVLLVLMQLGGIGYMTFGSFIVLSRRRRISQVREGVARRAFSLPQGMGLLHFLRNVVVFTLLFEAAGTTALYLRFAELGVEAPLWSALFHSVSAFCTAGFSLYDDSLSAFRSDFWVHAIVLVSSLGGAIGFIVFTDVWDMLRRRKQHVTLTTRVILWAILWLIGLATVALFVGDAALAGHPPHERLLIALFQATSAVTTVGFNTVPIGDLSAASLTLIVAVMVIGASPSGTGGGAKVTSASALLAVSLAALRGTEKITFWGSEVPRPRILAATGAVTFYVLALLVASYLLALTEQQPFQALLFEATSALGTVGLSTGITPELSPLGKLTIVAVMFLGRVGPITMATAMFVRTAPRVAREVEDVAV